MKREQTPLTSIKTGSGDNSPVVEVHDLVKHYNTAQGVLNSLLKTDDQRIRAVDGVSFELRRTETLGLVGESGCGKSTLARTLLRLEEPTDGEIYFRGEDITATSERSLRPYRGEIQFIHQDPSSSLNPRKRVEQILSRPLQLHTDLDRDERTDRIAQLLNRVGLDSTQRHRYPHEFSGGQRQRIEIARALSVNPSVVVADEPTSALDVTVQAQILQLLEDLRDEFQLSMLFISHDLRTVRYIADRTSVMYLGKLVELGDTETVFESPRHPYTQSLLTSAPSVEADDNRTITLQGEPPNPVDPPSGCRFHPRCPVSTEVCTTSIPSVHAASKSHFHRCHFVDADIHTETASEPADRNVANGTTDSTAGGQ